LFFKTVYYLRIIQFAKFEENYFCKQKLFYVKILEYSMIDFDIIYYIDVIIKWIRQKETLYNQYQLLLDYQIWQEFR